MSNPRIDSSPRAANVTSFAPGGSDRPFSSLAASARVARPGRYSVVSTPSNCTAIFGRNRAGKESRWNSVADYAAVAAVSSINCLALMYRE